MHDDSESTDRGHRVLPHTADLIVEAWAPDLPACIEEAVTGLTATYTDGVGARTTGELDVPLTANSPEALLLGALDELIYVLDTSPDTPIGVAVHEQEGGDANSIELRIRVADPESVTFTGAGPKAISRSGLHLVRTDAGGYRCEFLVDV